MKHDQYWAKPKKLKVVSGVAEAWYYVGRGGIGIHVQPKGVDNHIMLTLTRSELARYLKRSAQS